MGSGIGYPPTKFQRVSRCGGTYCEPSYLQNYGDDFVTTVNTQLNSDNASLASENSQTAFSSAGHNIVKLSDKNSSYTQSILGLCMLEIPFWFSKDPGLSIPLIALQNPNIYMKIMFAAPGDGDFDQTLIATSASGISHNGTVSGTVSESISAENNCQNVFTDLNPLIDNTANPKMNFDIDVNALYIYLDTDERRRFASVSHEYLIEQVQFILGDTANEIEISSFSHPVKELIWTGAPFKQTDIVNYKSDNNSDTIALNNGKKAHKSGVRFQPSLSDNETINNGLSKAFGPKTSPGADMDDSFVADGKFVVGLLGPSTPSCLDNCNWSISLNGIERSTPQPLQQFTRYNVERYHSGYGSVSCPDSIAVYSFALKPEEHQPSGTCNFSKIDSVKLKRDTSLELVKLHIYCVNYNILRFMGGQVSLAYNL